MSYINRKPFIFAVSGVKNSGKTTLITKLIKEFDSNRLKVAVIKHDGHDFNYDVPNTDTFKCFESGAYATAVFSDSKYMIVKKEKQVTSNQLTDFFPEADIIIIEGMKSSTYPKIEVMRRGISDKTVSSGGRLMAIATDLLEDELSSDVAKVDINDISAISQIVYSEMKKTANGYSAVILAGGKSRRMGRDKAKLMLGGKTFLQLQIEKLKNIGFEEILVSGYSGSMADAVTVDDIIKGKGPLAGLHSCLECMTNARCLVVPVDVPFIPEKDIMKLIESNIESNSLITVLSHDKIIEPLVGIYSKELSKEISEAVKKEEYSVMGYIKKHGYEIYETNSLNNLYANINYYEDYLKIKDND